MSGVQHRVLGIVAAHHLRGLWYRSAASGQRVTLASLYRAGALKRRAWRGEEGDHAAAYEYRRTAASLEVLRSALTTDASR